MIDNKLKIIAVLKLGENLMKETKVAVFGTGFFYQKQKEKLYANCNIEVCAFFDNNKERWGAELDGIMIYSPQNVNYVQYDYIVLMSGYATDMYEQLIHLGVNQCKILLWGELRGGFVGFFGVCGVVGGFGGLFRVVVLRVGGGDDGGKRG